MSQKFKELIGIALRQGFASVPREDWPAYGQDNAKMVVQAITTDDYMLLQSAS